MLVNNYRNKEGRDWEAVQLNRRNSKNPDDVGRSLGADGGEQVI